MNFTGKRECGQSRLCITYVCTGANNGKNKSNLYINGKKCFEKLLSLAEGMQTKLCILPKIKTFRCTVETHLDLCSNDVSYLWPNCRKAQLLYINMRAKILYVGQLRAPIVRVVLCVKKPTEAADLANHL